MMIIHIHNHKPQKQIQNPQKQTQRLLLETETNSQSKNTQCAKGTRSGEKHEDLLIQHCEMQEHCPTAEVTMNQYNVNKVLQKFYDQGAVTIEEEVRQLLIMDAIKLEKPKDLAKEYQHTSLRYLMFPK